MALRLILLSIALLEAFSVAPLPAQDEVPASVYRRALSALKDGEAGQAERTLAEVLRKHPRDARALGLMGVILDAQRRFDLAERYYNQALEISPHSAPLLNNLGNHYLAQGDAEHARAAFARVVALDPDHPNANLQLAQMSVVEKKGARALAYLDHLPREDQAASSAQLLRAQALDLNGQRAKALNLLAKVEEQTPRDVRVAFAIGMTYASWERFEDAERAFALALEAEPTDFDILYNLGLAAMRAGHLDRAQEVLGIALKQRPKDIDTLYNLARVRSEQGHPEEAITLLVETQHLAPQRPDILLLTAQTAETLGYYADTAAALDQYLKLRPTDDVARRELAFALARTSKFDEAIPALRRYVQTHPKDARGVYELGIAETIHERDQAFEHLTRAIEIDPNLVAARYARAVLNYQGGKFAQAADDLKVVLAHEPKNFNALDTLGECYLQLKRAQEAEASLSRAAQLAPNDTKILMHYSRALLRTGRKQEATAVLHKIEELRPGPQRGRPYSGLLDFLNLPFAEQKAQYLANVEGRIRMNTQDPSLRVRLGKELLTEGKMAEAAQAFREVLPLTSENKLLIECAKALLSAEQYDAAQEFLQRVVAADPASDDARLDLAIASFHVAGPAAGLAELEKMPTEQRRGDYFLLRAQMLDAEGRLEEARESLNRGFRAAPTRPDLYFQAALFLIKHEQYQRAVDLVQKALQVLPGDPELLLTEAIAYGLMDRPEESHGLLTQIESRWPEWSKPYLIEGIILSGHAKFAEAKPVLETAVALGSNEAAAYYNLALADSDVVPPDIEGAQRAIQQGLRLNSDDAFIQSLAGKIAYERKDYQAALNHLNAALRIWPDMAEAHQSLSATYRALGEKEKSASELKEVLRIKQQYRTADQAPPSSPASLLFSVRPSQP
jgi:tetratricopeptide (TPR) repeat protein